MEKVAILVVEDEILLSKDIVLRLEEMDYHVVDTVPSAALALTAIQEGRKKIDLLLIDIILKGPMDGIELARIINRKHQLPFIFLTSHADKHLVERAKSVNPSAYMLKPFNDRAIMVSIELALANYDKKSTIQTIAEKPLFSEQDNQALRIKDSLFLKKEHHFKRVPFKEILWLEAEGNYSSIFTNSGKYIYSTLLKRIEQKLPSDQFLRVHRSYVVNMLNVTGFIGNLLYVGEKSVPVSKSHSEVVFKWFNTI